MKTKIVATVGPASESPEMLAKMNGYGLTLVRINSAHAETDYVSRITKAVRSINPDVGVMIDLKGPELRTGTFAGGRFEVQTGREYRIGRDITINNDRAFDNVEEGDSVLMSDGEVEFTLIDKKNMIIRASNNGVLRDRSRVNIPGRFVEIGSLTDRDKAFILKGIEEKVDFFALSFVQNDSNVKALRDVIIDNGGDQYIISKIETKSGLDNIDSISRASDGIMVARGDLGVEIPLKEVVMAQKEIIRVAHQYGIFTIVATQVLESMVNNSVPTRAEISDITNAIIDGADAIMLSEESAIGKYPDLAVKTLSDVSNYVENLVNFRSSDSFLGNRIAFSVAMAAKVLADDINADGIVALTHTGSTVRMLSSLRPRSRIYAATVSKGLSRKLNIFFGVTPLNIRSDAESLKFEEISDYLKDSGFFRKGDKIVLTSGDPYFVFGGTNDVRVIVIGDFLARGYPTGKSIEGIATYKGNGDILISDSTEINDTKYSGYIFTCSVKPETMRKLEGKTVIVRTRIAKKIDEGEKIFIDGNTGIIVRSN